MCKPIYRIYALAFLLDAAILMGFTAMPFFVFRQLGGGAQMSGTIASAQSICYAAACIISARYVMRVRHGLRLAAAGAAVYSMLFAGAVFAPGPAVFAVATVAALTCMSVVWPALQSWLGGDPDPKRRARQISIFNLCWSTGMAAGAFAAGPLYEWDHRYPFLGVLLMGGTAMMLILSLPSEQAYFGDRIPAREGVDAAFAPDKPSEVHLQCTWFANMVGWALLNAVSFVYPARIEALAPGGQLRLFWEAEPYAFMAANPATKFSWMATAMLLGRAGIFLLMGMVTTWRHRLAFLVTLQVAAALACLTLAYTNSLAVMIACAVIVGINAGSGFFASLYYSLANPVLKHRRAALNEATVGIGSFTGAQGGALLAGAFGLTVAFGSAPLWVGLAIGAEVYLLRRSRARLDVEN